MRTKYYDFIVVNKQGTKMLEYKNIDYGMVEKYINGYWNNTLLKNICDYKVVEVKDND